MPVELRNLADLPATPHDTLIDVRAPSEFEEDHLPGAINMPVLSDAERARVGTIYTQESAFTARKVGAALVARNAARHLEGPLQGKSGAWRPLVYCWRGGQRSGSFATILGQVGWRVQVIEGGYRSYRRLVVRALYDDPWPTRIVLLDGYTGTAKTEILQRVAALGYQVIDLEGLARHRGSVFGAMDAQQPSQKTFESQIASALAGFNPARPVLIEAESSKVGNLVLPQGLWKAMRTAPRLRIDAPLNARAAFLARAYTDLTTDPTRLFSELQALRPYHGTEQVAVWQGMAGQRAWEALARALMEAHYDPRYRKSRLRAEGQTVEQVTSDTLDDAALDRLAREVAARIAA
ncbi:MAG: tRNA 2-selenouridine(34) synthase MnmH [Pseudomonadota bacterium]